jgi:ergot alkaloid biosynthesis protein
MRVAMTDQPKILLTGGTGNTASAIAGRLASRGHRVRLACRNAPGGNSTHRHVVFDWADASTHAPALTGIERVYLVPPLAVLDPVPMMEPFIELALSHGVRRIVLLSASVIPEGSPGVGTVHALLRGRAPEWAVLQPSWFMQNFTGNHYMAEDARAGFLMTSTGEGRVPFVDVEDIAEVGARALIDDKPHNAAHVITGPHPHTYAEVASILSEVSGRAIEHRQVSPTEVRARMVASGVPEEFAEILTMLEGLIRDGGEDRVTPTVQEVTGRAPRSFREFAEEHAEVWSLPSPAKEAAARQT